MRERFGTIFINWESNEKADHNTELQAIVKAIQAGKIKHPAGVDVTSIHCGESEEEEIFDTGGTPI